MKILHIAQAPGGVERYIHTLLSHIDQSRYENVLLCSKQFNKENFIGLTSAVEELSMKRNIGPGDIKNVMAIRKIIKKYNPDIVYCHSSKAGAVGRLACVGLGVKTVHNAHGWAFNMKGAWLMHLLYIFVEWFLGLFTDKIICISNSEYIDAKRKHIGNEKTRTLIYNGVDIQSIEHRIASSSLKRADLGIPEDAFVIGMNGRISQQKAPDVFVRMAVKLKKAIPNVFFIIIGDGKEREQVQKNIEEVGLKDSFYITGWVDDVAPFLKMLDVGVLLSRWEGFGLALCEYMVAGLPIVATNVDAIPEVVNDGVNGLLVNMDDDEAAYKAVLRLHDEKKLYSQMSEKAKQIVKERFDVKRTVEQHECLFENL